MWIMCSKAIECWSIPSIDTVDQHSINTLVDTRSTIDQHLHWQLLDDWLIFNWCIRVSCQSATITKCWSSVNQVSTEYQLGCRSSTNQDVDQGYQSTVDHRSYYYTWSKYSTNISNSEISLKHYKIYEIFQTLAIADIFYK